jgi:pimeloyl-ACP methyl ester carboxylesterase
MSGRWLREPSGGTVVIFLHGLFSSTDTAWRSRTAFWPDLLRDEESLKDAGIYLFDYETTLSSGTYSAADATHALNAYFDIHNLWKHPYLAFVAHSMGGIIARYLLVSRQQQFIANGIKCAFFLVASPSLGSNYASVATNLGLIHNVQLDGLKFSETNVWLNELDTNFRNLRDGGKPVIVGCELGEAEPIFLSRFLLPPRRIVMPASAYRYFGDPLVVPGSDHISIAKPADRNSLQHQLLVKFVSGTPGRPGG